MKIKFFVLSAVIVLIFSMHSITGFASENELLYDFENGDTGDVCSIGDDDIKSIVTDPLNPENNVLYMETGNKDEWFQSMSRFRIGTDSKFYGKVLIDFDFMIPADSAPFNEGFDFYLKKEKTAENLESYRQVQFSPKQLVFLLSSTSSVTINEEDGYSADEWHDLKMIIDVNEFTADAFFDDKFIVSMPVWGSGTAVRPADYLYTMFIKCTGKGAKMYLDNVNVKQIDALTLVSSSPSDKSENVNVGDKIFLMFNNKLRESSLFLNSSAAVELLKADEECMYYFMPELLWNTDYNISGTATDIYGQSVELNLNIKTSSQPDSYVILKGFYNEEGNEILNLKKGRITAKLDFWQTADTHYTLIAALYRMKDGVIEMIDVNAASVQSGEENLVSKFIDLNIPDEDENCFVNIMVWNNLKEGIPLNEKIFCGKNRLERR